MEPSTLRHFPMNCRMLGIAQRPAAPHCRRGALGNVRFGQILWAALTVSLVCKSAVAQLPQTRLHAVFPPGAQVGSTGEITVTSGVDLEELNRLLFNHPGITAAPKMQDQGGKQAPVPNVFTVTVSADVPVGAYEVRAIGLYGISNPRTFTVGSRKELVETEPNNVTEQAQALELGTTVNGRINGATDVDCFKIAGQPGQRLLVECFARRIDSKLDASLELHDATGRRIAAARNNVSRDPLLDVTLPAAGEYVLRVTDFVYAGGEDFFYRLTAHTGPYVDYVWPPAAVAGSTAPYTLFGRNLPGGQPSGIVLNSRPLEKLDVSITAPADASQWDGRLPLEPSSASLDGFAYSFVGASGSATPVLMTFSPTPVQSEVEPNNLPAQAQKITLPAELAGQFQAKGDIDLFQFEAKAGQTYWIEVEGQRLGTGADPYLTLDQVITNDKGEETLKRIAAVDDDGANLLPNVFDTLNDDPVYKFAVPTDGVYRVAVRDRYAASRGNPSLVYRLSFRTEAPDFRLVVVPTGPTPANQKQALTWPVGLRRGDNFLAYALVLRRDGFTGPVDVFVEGLPLGVTCRDITVGTTPSSGTLVFTAAEDAPAWSGLIRVNAKARIEDSAKAAAVVAAQAAKQPANDALVAADKELAKAVDDLTKANEAVKGAKAELDAKPDDEGLKKTLADAEAKATAAAQAHEAIAAKRNAADQKVKETAAAHEQAVAANQAAAREVVHPARTGTVVWSGQPNVPGDARLSQALELSVIEEPAPFQLVTEVHRVVAHHNRQVLVPVKLIKRPGFDANVNLTFVGQPQNVQVENKAINKDKPDEIFRIFVPPNAPVGTSVMYLAGQAQVSYRRNPQKADRLKAEFDVADKAAAAAVETQKLAAAKKDETAKQLPVAQEALKKAIEAKTAADKALVDAQNAEKAAAEAVKNAGDNVDAKTEAEKKLTEAQAASKTATDNVASAEKARADAEAAAKVAEQNKVTAENEAKQAEEAVKATTAEKAAADKRFKDADNAAKPQNVNYLPPTTSIVLTIKPAPYTLSATPADGGNVKQGGKLEVKAEVKRQNGFYGPVTLTLPLPPNVVGVKAEPVTIPADQTAGVLIVEAAADSPEAQLPNMVVRAVSQFEGEAAVDQPVTLKVVK